MFNSLTKKNHFFIFLYLLFLLFAIEFSRNCPLCRYCPTTTVDECCAPLNKSNCFPELSEISSNHSEDFGCSCIECILTYFKQKDVYEVRYLNDQLLSMSFSPPHSAEPELLSVRNESFLKTKRTQVTAPLYLLNQTLII